MKGYVKWYDAHGGSGEWKDIATAYEPMEVTTMGFIQEFDEGLVVTPSMAPEHDGQGFGEVHIPKGCIVEVRYF